MPEEKDSGLLGHVGKIVAVAGGIVTLVIGLQNAGYLTKPKPADEPAKPPVHQVEPLTPSNNGGSDAPGRTGRITELEKKIEDMEANERQKKEAELQSRIEDLERKAKANMAKNEGGGGRVDDAKSSRISLSGNWYDDNTGASYVFTQYGNEVTFQEMTNYYGQPIVSVAGSGYLQGNTLNLQYQTLMGTTGEATLTIGGDGDELTGRTNDFSTGASMPLNLYR